MLQGTVVVSQKGLSLKWTGSGQENCRAAISFKRPGFVANCYSRSPRGDNVASNFCVV